MICKAAVIWVHVRGLKILWQAEVEKTNTHASADDCFCPRVNKLISAAELMSKCSYDHDSHHFKLEKAFAPFRCSPMSEIGDAGRLL